MNIAATDNFADAATNAADYVDADATIINVDAGTYADADANAYTACADAYADDASDAVDDENAEAEERGGSQ